MSYCKARTRKQIESANWGDYNVGCGNKATVEVNELGVGTQGGIPVCRMHQAQWAKGLNYGVN